MQAIFNLLLFPEGLSGLEGFSSEVGLLLKDLLASYLLVIQVKIWFISIYDKRLLQPHL